MRNALAVAVVMTCGACVDDSFTGDAGSVRFISPLSRQFETFSPDFPIAVGSPVSIAAVSATLQTMKEEPFSMPAASGAAVRQDSFRVDNWTGVAVAAGTTSFVWSGQFSDSFTVKVAQASTLELSDPLIFYLRDHLVEYGGPSFPDVGDHFQLAPGGSLELEVVPRDDGGTVLSFAPGWLELDGGDAYALLLTQNRLSVTAPSSGPATTTFSLVAPDGGVSHTFTIDTPADPAADVERIVLASGRLGSNAFIVRAAVFLTDGGVLWEPDIQWAFSGTVLDLQAPKGEAEQYPKRRDMKALAISAPRELVQASYSNTLAAAVLEWGDGGVAMMPAPPVTPPATPSGCGCSSSPATIALLALGVMLARARGFTNVARKAGEGRRESDETTRG